MVAKIRELIVKYKELISYGIFGVLTTVINIAVYTVCYNLLGISNVVSNVIAWILSVLFAYVTNKIWVFESKSTEWKVLIYEMGSFFGCRLATGLLDLAIMYVTVDKLALNSTLMKCVSNVIVIIANYIFSKLVIF
ncbi:MAG: GtrA family protein, partial [Clostridiales bacterium]|nr:GtrA family protein [Clostridiales bacterium]MDY4113216.1 GtrA family protein [Roseburia sp.]